MAPDEILRDEFNRWAAGPRKNAAGGWFTSANEPHDCKRIGRLQLTASKPGKEVLVIAEETVPK